MSQKRPPGCCAQFAWSRSSWAGGAGSVNCRRRTHMATTIDRVTDLADLARTVVTGERAGYNTTDHLAHAARQAQERNYQDLLIVDADAHHYETESSGDIVNYIEHPELRPRAHRGRSYDHSSTPPV